MHVCGSSKIKSRLLAALSFGALATGLSPCITQAAPAAAGQPLAPVTFAHTRSDISPDPRARYGRLANGMTYVIVKNQTPPGTGALFLRFGAGSLMEQDYQRGLAHFLEHMAFNGSRNVPQGEMVKILERDGLAFGADTNAATSFDQTVYSLNISKVTEKAMDDSLFLMREVASNLLLDPGAVDRQRGVILGEERLRDSVEVRASESATKALLPGLKLAEREPIGLVDVIKTAPAMAIRDFYRDFYQPQYATLVIVGDIEPDEIEAKIRARFSDWKSGPQSKNAVIDFGAYTPKGPTAHVYTEKGLTNSLSLTWVKPPEDQLQTRETVFRDLLRNISFSIMSERFRRQTFDPNSTFVSAQFSQQDLDHTATLYSLEIVPKPKQDRAAFDQTLTLLRQFLTYGVSQEEFDRQLLRLTTFRKEMAGRDDTRSTASIANEIASAIEQEAVFTSDTQNLALFESLRPRLTLSTINEYLKHLDLGDGPFIDHQGENVSDFDKEAMLSAYKSQMATAVAPAAPYHAKTWPYTDFGPAGRVIDRTALADIGAARITFANGVKLNFKATTYSKNDISVSVRFGGGYLAIPPNDAVVLKAADKLGIQPGGLGKITAEDVSAALTGKLYILGFTLSEGAAYLSGSTVPSSFDTQMQVLMAYATDAAFRPIALERLHAWLPNYYLGLKSGPSGVFGMKGAPFLHGGDLRFGIPPQEAMMAVRNDQIKALWARMLNDTPIEITIVGDTTEDEAVKQVAATFGTLPLRPARVTPAPGADVERFPTADLHQVYTDNGRPDQNMSVMAWPTDDFYSNEKEVSGLGLLTSIMTSRLLAEVRERQGASYGVSAHNSASNVFKKYGALTVVAMVKPEIDSTFYESVKKIAESLKSKPVTADEITRARQPMLDGMEAQLKTNGYWSGLLNGSVAEPRQIEAYKTSKQRLLGVTAQDIQDLAKKYLDMSKVAHIQVKAG